MSIHPIDYDDATQIYKMWHDEKDHGFDLIASEITFVDPDGFYANIACPVCGGNTTHPVSGGADPPNVQPMFVRLYTSKLAIPFDDALTLAKDRTEESGAIWQPRGLQ